MRPNRPLIFGSYLVAFFLVSIPLTEILTSVLPISLGDANWRFGAIGVFSRALMTPLLGLVLAIGLATYRSNRALLRVLGVMSGLAGVFLMGTLLVFVLDAQLMRGQVIPEAEQSLEVASVFASAKLVFAALITLALGWGAWRLSAKKGAF